MKLKQGTSFGRKNMCESTLLFLYFFFGTVAVLMAVSFFPSNLPLDAELPPMWLFLAASVIVLFAGETVFGTLLIPAATFAFGAAFSLMISCSLFQKAGFELLLSRLLFAGIAVPSFFLISVLGLKSASMLRQALRLAGRNVEREARGLFLFRWALFAGLVLCVFLLHNILYR